MKRALTIVGVLVFAAFLCVVSFMAGVSFLSWRSERQLNTIVSALPPGTPLSSAVARLGQPTRTITNSDEMRVFDRDGAHPAEAGTTLYLFVHRGPPLRWVLVYADGTSQTIRHAEWQHM